MKNKKFQIRHISTRRHPVYPKINDVVYETTCLASAARYAGFYLRNYEMSRHERQEVWAFDKQWKLLDFEKTFKRPLKNNEDRKELEQIEKSFNKYEQAYKTTRNNRLKCR